MREFCKGPFRKPAFGDRRFGGKGYFSGEFHLRKHRSVDSYRDRPLQITALDDSMAGDVIRGHFMVGEVQVGEFWWLYG